MRHLNSPGINVLFLLAAPEECLRLAAQLRDSHAEGKSNVEKLLSINKAHRSYIPTKDVEDGLNMFKHACQARSDGNRKTWTILDLSPGV